MVGQWGRMLGYTEGVYRNTTRVHSWDSGVSRRPDIWVEATDSVGARHWIIVENKIDSGEGENQLADYAKILEEASELKSRTLVYITKYSSETNIRGNDKVKFKHLRWSKVYDFLQKKLQDNNRRELGIELLGLMEDWNTDGTLSTAHLRAAVICFNSEIGGKLQRIQDEAFTSSGIRAILEDKMNGKKWSYTYGRDRGGQWVNEIPGYGIALWMGFRFDRRDEDWDVERIELPSPFVAVTPKGENKEVGERMSQPSERWTGPLQDSIDYEWVRQPVRCEMPHMGEPLDEFYRNFFHISFEELKRALEGID